MAEYTTAGFEVPVVTYAAKDLPPACVENGHHGTRSNAGQETSPEDSVTAGHTGRSHLASPEVPESLSSRDSPSSTKQETVAVDLTNEFCTDKQESPPGIGADHSRIATPARPLTDAAVLASTAGPCDDDKALEDMPKAHDEMTLEASGDAGNESPETVSPQAPDTPVDVPDFAADESPQEVLGEAPPTCRVGLSTGHTAKLSRMPSPRAHASGTWMPWPVPRRPLHHMLSQPKQLL